jgi:hypothetical protein
MRALLTVTHRDEHHKSYMLECPHGSTSGEARRASLASRETYVAGLLARHGVPYGCTCAAETDLADVYPSIESAIEQIPTGASQGSTELDDDAIADLLRKIDDVRCPECSVAVLVLPLHVPLEVEAIHERRCPCARPERAGQIEDAAG